jgi:hypothetical protein
LDILDHLPGALDFSRSRYESLTAEDDHVVAAITIGVTRSDATVTISGHWTLGEGRPCRWVLLDPLGIQHGLREN